ncbi:armadillo-type protein [Scenedesmus sp. NREL 46B-D3]|nr:armadillo-type protein [Scenedesmus sp. NREL 46B-D3]
MEEAAEIQGLVAAVVESGGAQARSCYDRYKAILTKYQEQPQLLDGHLEGIVQPLAVLLRSTALSSTAQDTGSVQNICRLLHVLISVRGYKTVVRFFPHEASDLERVLQVLGFVADARAAADTAADNSSISLWEAQAVLLLWLSILVLIPFDLVILDSEVTCASSRAAAQLAYTPLAGRIMRLCQAYLQHPGAVREMAALLLARLLTRPDMAAALADFLQWQQQALAAAAGPAAVFLLPGVLQTLALVFKFGRREQLLPLAPQLWQQVAGLLGDGSGSSSSSGLGSNALARKLAVKLVQRIGLVLLPPQLAGWRYVKTAADLGQNLSAAGAGAGADHTGAPADAPGTAAAGGEQQQDAEAAGAAATEIPEETEDVLGVLLSSCCDRDTVVRWSAAKGVGRLASCLPLELAEEVVDGVMTLLVPSEPDSAWHGGCLAIAELARRSILSPVRLPALSPLLQQALAYDVRRGPCSVGAHVRDAAAYVCWALARAYEPQQLSACVAELSASLLTMACYDREVNCRRAAASAFQECVGRLGSFPHGLEILAVADYFSVGNAANAYLHVAPFVAQFPEYTSSLLQHLADVKLRHWDRALRALAAMGLAGLAPVAAPQLAGHALPQLLKLVTADVLEVRAGAVLGVAELLPALAAVLPPAASPPTAQTAAGSSCRGALGACLQPAVAEGVVGVLGRLEAAGLYRGKGGELMREAAARLVEQVAAAAGSLGVVPLVQFGPTKRQQQQQQEGCSSGKQRQQATGPVDDVDEAEEEDGDADLDAATAAAGDGSKQDSSSKSQRRPPLQLLLTPEYHTSALRLVLDCLGHVQNSIQASGVAALKSHACAFQADTVQRPQLLALVQQCCSRVADRDALPAARRGAAAALGVLPAGLIRQQAGDVLAVLAAAAQVPGVNQAGLEVETRIAAVSSLAQLTLELLTSSSEGTAAAAAEQPGDSIASMPMQVVTGCVFPALLGAFEDYTRDNRGDVGSWVREAAMDGLAELVLALGSMQQQQQDGVEQGQQQQQQQQQHLQDAAAMLPTDVASMQPQLLQQQQQQQHSTQPDGAAGWHPSSLVQLHRRLALLVVSGMLRQSLERIARLREAALTRLQQLLGQPATAAAVPGAAGIAAALPDDAAELAGVASLACVAKLGGLLQLQWYRLPLLEGLVASIGGVDASLAKAASAALLSQLEGGATAAAAAAEVAAATPEVRSLREDVAALLLQLWQTQTGSLRLSLPLIKTAALLITHAGFAGVSVSGSAVDIPAAATSATAAAAAANDDSKQLAAAGAARSFAWGALQLLKQELRGCSDVSKLLEGASLMAQLACIGDCSGSAIQSVMVLLVNRVPKVRRHMAEQLYLQMLAVQAEADAEHPREQQQQQSVFEAVPAEDLEAALDVLLISPWDGPIDQARAGREELAGHLQIDIRTRRVTKASEGKDAAAMLAPNTAEHESYQSLLDDAARGGGY